MWEDMAGVQQQVRVTWVCDGQGSECLLDGGPCGLSTRRSEHWLTYSNQVVSICVGPDFKVFVPHTCVQGRRHDVNDQPAARHQG